MRTCKGCGKAKAASEFYDHAARCKVCVCEERRDAYHSHPEFYRAIAAVYYSTHKVERIAKATARKQAKRLLLRDFSLNASRGASEGGASLGDDTTSRRADDLGLFLGKGPALRDSDHVVAHISEDTSEHIPVGKVGLVKGSTEGLTVGFRRD